MHSLRGDSRYAHGGTAARPDGSERRRLLRDAVNGEPSRSRLVALVLGTYAEMPGLSLHLNQAARLFGLREGTCEVVLDDLVNEGRLRRSRDGQYRASGGGDF
jgi:hypothetical protein